MTAAGVRERLRRLDIGTWVMALVAWLTVITGTYIVYPWYRAKPPEGLADLSDYPRSFLLSRPELAAWHTSGMEWKEHVACYGRRLWPYLLPRLASWKRNLLRPKGPGSW